MREPVEELDYLMFGRRLLADASRDRRPIINSIALTYRCNLNCVHCYVADSRGCAEISTEKWLGIIDQLADAGCLWLTITGGEPLLRPDFETIYCHAQKRGMLVAVFTNGILVDDRHIDLWCERPPHVVEISVYGYSRETYREITGSAEARDACFDAVQRLTDARVPLRLKTMALRQNIDEVDQLREFSTRLNIPFRFDPIVSPELSGSKRPCSARLDVDQVLRLDSASGDRLNAWTELLARYTELPTRRHLFSCAAGKVSCFVQPDGFLCMCVYDVPLYDLNRGTFLEGWHGVVRRRTEITLSENHPCFGCSDALFCDVCPPIARMETGSELGYSDDLCKFGKQRSSMVQSRVLSAGRATQEVRNE